MCRWQSLAITEEVIADGGKKQRNAADSQAGIDASRCRTAYLTLEIK